MTKHTFAGNEVFAGQVLIAFETCATLRNTIREAT